ncbi:MAG: hypothetical protein CME60_07260 [Halobacteriovoraceae bacterium]|nr:hypothetical protein [Halobacteriovoraceae bacterium]
MVDINFYNIRSLKGSQQEGFEELVCQLAHLLKPDGGKYFVRKDGAGGDAGVECYWILEDGSEYGWQAKYFPDTLGNSQWAQIDKSVRTALDKHPKLRKYYVCLPRDWNDSRTEKKGKRVKTAWDKWCEYVKKWEQLASQKGLSVEFEYWCKHEITTFLTSDNPQLSGRALYWFNEPVLNNSSLYKIANIARDALGDRFSEELHLDLPISNIFDGVGINGSWADVLKEKEEPISNAKDKYLNEIIRNTRIETTLPQWGNLLSLLDSLLYPLSMYSLPNKFLEFVDGALESLELSEELVEKCLESLNDQLKKDVIDKELFSKSIGVINRVSEELDGLASFFESRFIKSALRKSVILLGEAGIGKSHLLCDLTFKRLSNSMPTLFVLGNHYEGGNVVSYLGKSLDLANFPRSQVLGAMDACGEASGARFLVVIDAINEGRYKDDWYTQIVPFFSEISNYKNIAVVISCRSTFKDYLIPGTLGKDTYVEVEHKGFSGYEHKAASIYLSKHGIVPPSVPILSPEFTNPLFLKTCCDGIKESGNRSFPKGINGISALFNFYIDSISKIINRKKKYLSGESIVNKSLDSFVRALYPDRFYGVPVGEAREIIDSHDIKRGSGGGTLFELLIDEGILALDIMPDPIGDNKRGIEVIRFTYERFSDHFAALHIIELHTEDQDVIKLFEEEGFVGALVNNHKLFSYSGIIESLGIIIPEMFKKEFIDYIGTEDNYYKYLYEHTFLNVVKWRSNESFTQRTLELLNEARPFYFRDKRIEILLSFSTEPEHPWNADFLDRNLKRKKMPERDFSWSVPISVEDESEEYVGEVSTLRAVIDWSFFTDLSEIDFDRKRLTSIVLAWMTTTSNRTIRDQATKSLAKVLISEPDLILILLRSFKDVDDLYLQERIYAASYSSLCFIDDDSILDDVSSYIYKENFERREPYPNILLRDYARGIIELVNSKGALNGKEVDVELCRPPYCSGWPIENPSKVEIEEITGDAHNSSIKNSIMGFPGDFGNYSMSCVHRWSPTTLDKEKAQSGLDLYKEFSKKIEGELKTEFEKYLIQVESKQVDYNRRALTVLKQLSDEELDSILDNIEDEDGKDDYIEWADLKNRLEDQLDPVLKEELRWISGLSVDDSLATVSKKWMQRWVCKRAYSLGWKKEFFERYEDSHCQRGRGSEKSIERIGKKYQWIAFRELLARLSDNLFWIDRGYSDVEDSVYYGPWQVNERDIDPTLLLRKTFYDSWSDSCEKLWWRPYVFEFSEKTIEEQVRWVWDKENIPSFEQILNVTSDEGQKFLSLSGFSKNRVSTINGNESIADQDAWYRINSIVVNKSDLSKLQEKVINKIDLVDPHTVNVSSTGHQAFFKEYPWHPSCNDMNDWVGVEEHWYNKFGIKYLVPVCKYDWETGNLDKSIESSIYFYLPSETLIDEFSLNNNLGEEGEWKSPDGKMIFLDPSVKKPGPSYALVDQVSFDTWLQLNEYELVWLIGGEKQLFGRNSDKFYGRLIYSIFISYSNGEFKTKIWFSKHDPYP